MKRKYDNEAPEDSSQLVCLSSPPAFVVLKGRIIDRIGAEDEEWLGKIKGFLATYHLLLSHCILGAKQESFSLDLEGRGGKNLGKEMDCSMIVFSATGMGLTMHVWC